MGEKREVVLGEKGRGSAGERGGGCDRGEGVMGGEGERV